MLLTFKSLLRTIFMLGGAAIIGVTGATSATCGAGLLHGTGTFCDFPLIWFIGFPFAITIAIILGLPGVIFFRKFHLTKWWHFGIAGLICSVPLWWVLAQPFTSARWAHAGFYDSLNYLGSGFGGGLAYWRICQKVGIRNELSALPQETNRTE